MKKLYLIVINIILVFSVSGQIALPYINSLSPDKYSYEMQIWSIIQDADGRIWFGTTDGLYAYDGNNWLGYDFGTDNFIVRSLDISGDTIWYGSRGSFGYLTPDLSRKFINHTITVDSTFQGSFSNIWSTLKEGRYVLFAADTIIFKYDIQSKKVSKLLTGEFVFLSKFKKRIFISDYSKFYLFDAIKDSLETYTLKSNAHIIRGLEYKDDTLVLFCPDNIIFYDLGDRTEVKNIYYKDIIPDFKKITVYDIGKLPQGYAIGTVGNGLYILDSSFKFLYHLTDNEGLSTNTVLSLFVSDDGNLWAGTSDGLSLIEISLPFRSIDSRLGVKGDPYSAYKDDTLFVLGTNIGAYLLQEGGFKLIETNNGDIPRQIFKIKKIKFSDGYSPLVLVANTGLYKLDSENKATIFSDIFTYSVYTSTFNKDDLFFIGNNILYRQSYKNGTFYQAEKIAKLDDFYYLIKPDGYYLWFTGLYSSKAGYFDLKDSTVNIFSSDTSINGAIVLNGRYYLLTNRGLFEYDYNRGKLVYSDVVFNKFLKGRNIIDAIKLSSDKYGFLLSVNSINKFYLLTTKGENIIVDSLLFNSLPRVNYIYSLGKDSVLFLSKKKFIIYNADVFYNLSLKYKPIISQVVIDNDSILFFPSQSLMNDLSLVLNYRYNSFNIKCGFPYYSTTNDIEFSYWLEGSGKNKWSNWSKNNILQFNNLREGHYILHIIARNKYGLESDETIFSFRIKPPIYRTVVAYILYFIVFIVLIYLIIKLRYKKLIKQKQILETLITERTKKIEEQKEQLLLQTEKLRDANKKLYYKNEEVKTLLEQLEDAHIKVVEQHKHLVESITYARIIMSSMTKKQHKLYDYFPKNFIFFLPKDIIGGDFYLFERIDNNLILGVGDATGHGVAGALMAMMYYTFLYQIFSKGITNPATILRLLREDITKSIIDNTEESRIYSGLDIALSSINIKERKLLFAGARLPAIIIRGRNLISLKFTKSSIGFYETKNFELEEIDLQDGDIIYLFSDGYYDQFNEDMTSKFYRRRFYELLENISDLPLEEQEKVIRKKFMEWKGETFQTDDVTVLAVQVDFSIWDKLV